jgi:NAD(P)-dependent dehydrogenase (short-subunit alcohol dehydrogenase family)
MSTILITGTNRGIGLELVRQYADKGHKILACCRAPDQADALKAISGDVEIFALDVGSADSCRSLQAELSGRPVDILIHNAGVMCQRDFRIGNANYEEFLHVMNINTVGPYRVIDTLISNLRAGAEKKVVIVSSTMGTIAETSGGVIPYRASKAAANQVAASLQQELGGEGFKIIPVHPGWVRTDMGGPSGLISTEESATGLRKVIASLNEHSAGRFWRFDGVEAAW